MTKTQPVDLVRSVRRDVRRFKVDVDHRIKQLDERSVDPWIWEELIDKANFVFSRVQKLDKFIRHAAMAEGIEIPNDVYDEIDDLLRKWLELGLELQKLGGRVRPDNGSAVGFDELSDKIVAAKGALTADDEFFDSDRFVEYRDQAVDAFRAGEPEPLSDHAFVE